MDRIYELLRKAINEKKEVHIKFKYGIDGTPLSVVFHPYILGEDLMQYYFVWGFLPVNQLPYKFLLDNVIDVKISSTSFILNNKLAYHYALEEEHYVSISGFERIFRD